VKFITNQHLCDKNGWTIEYMGACWRDKHDHMGLLFHSLIMWPVQVAGKEEQQLIWLIKFNPYPANVENMVSS